MAEAPHLTFFFDGGFRDCTLVALHSVLRETPGEMLVHLHPTEEMDLTEAELDRFRQAFPALDLRLAPIDMEAFRHLPEGRRPLAARARLLLPEIHEGRVLYLDGDILVKKDIRPLWNADLEGALIGACLAPGVQALIELGRASRPRLSRKAAEKIGNRSKRLKGIDMRRYFNSGVMLFDLDAIRASGKDEEMRDIEATAGITSRDQDWLNIVFAGDCRVLPAEWNSGWGNPRTAERYVSPELREFFRESREDPGILHYTGNEKPWQAEKPPFYLHYLNKPLERRLRARAWAEFQAARRATEALLSRRLFDGGQAV